MIGYLKGTIIEKSSSTLTINVNGIGYEAVCPERNVIEQKVGGSIELFIHTAVKETAIDLYGFSDIQTRDIFRNLLSVSGIGPKSALSILNKTDAPQLVSAIQSNNPRLIGKVGARTAEKIVAALHGKIAGYGLISGLKTEIEHQDLIDALASLGYSQSQISAVLAKIPSTAKSTEEQIKEALKMFQR